MFLEGIVDNIIYRNHDTGYTVLELDTQSGLECIVGIMPMVSEGEYVETNGEYKLHHTYGRQFVVSTFETALPQKETAILKYLSSGIIKGIGPKTARLIVDKFGPATFQILENDPEELETIRGISHEKAIKICESMNETKGVKNILLYFQQFGLTSSVAFKVYKEWGASAYDIISKNPYRLCEIQGFTFEKADNIASRMELPEDNPERIKAALSYILFFNLYDNGHTFLPREKLVSAAENLLSVSSEIIEKELQRLVDGGYFVFVEKISNTNGVYLKWVYEKEKNVADRIALSSAFSHGYNGNFSKDIAEIEKELHISFAENQKEAIKQSSENGIFVLTGGPGTGKTTALKGIVRLLEKNDLTYALCAPTGRAAKRISELCGKDAKTIHRLLEYSKDGGFGRNENNKLEYDVVIVDEASMLDLIIFDGLFSALPLSSTVILVGDINQLPPVGPGSVLKDVIKSGKVKTVVLDEIFRQAKESLIVTNAHKIINGDFPEIHDKKHDFFFLPAKNTEEVLKTVCELYSYRLPNAYDFDPLTDIQVITPTKKGNTGTVNLNEVLKDCLNPPRKEEEFLRARGKIFYHNDKVMQTKNNYDVTFERKNGEVDTGVFNGDIGTVNLILQRQECITVQFDDKEVCYTVEMLEDLDHAYAITVHKSQGSEFEAVILPLWDGPDILYTRNLLYTAVTRAKKLLIIVGSEERLKSMIDNNVTDKRYSGLKFMLSGK